MNKIVRESFPVSRLPQELRDEVGDAEYVRIEIDVEARSAPTLAHLLRLAEEVRRQPPIGDDPVARIRELRDEWDA